MHLMLISTGASLEKEETSLNMNAVNYKDKCTINNNLSSITKGPFPPQAPKGNQINTYLSSSTKHSSM